jgi:hypothetical protein
MPMQQSALLPRLQNNRVEHDNIIEVDQFTLPTVVIRRIKIYMHRSHRLHRLSTQKIKERRHARPLTPRELHLM